MKSVYVVKIFFITLLLSWAAFASSETVVKKAQAFFTWLDSQESVFANCEIQKKGDDVHLCDGTKVSYNEIKKFFSEDSDKLLKKIQAKGVEVEIICSSDSGQGDFLKSSCVSESTDKTFKKVSSLHGLYVSEKNKIFIRGGATKGTLIHEYLHFLQTKNTNKVAGRVYKAEKNQLKGEINKELDRLESDVQTAEKNKQKGLLQKKVAEFMKVNDFMLAFGKWQDLIDERSLFLFFMKFEKDFNIPQADMDMVRKNIGFICKRSDYKSKLPECP